MINFDKYKNELTKINCNNLAVDKVTCEPVNYDEEREIYERNVQSTRYC